MERIHVAGTASFAAEIVEYARAAGLEVAGLIELVDASRVGTVRHGLEVVAPDAPPAGGTAVIGAGGDRDAMWSLLAGHGWSPATVVHPAAVVSPSAGLAPGCVIGPLAVLGAGARVGEQALVGRGALVGHHVRIGPGATVNPGANIGGNSSVGRGAQLGMGATIVHRVSVGAGAVVAAGAVVVGDVEAGSRVQGVPARAYEVVEAPA
jgi:sugar O-acyltransferase (sialic acid O-acetyltransferase NeuD family)